MQLKLLDLLRVEHILTGVSAPDAKAAISILAKPLLDDLCVSDDFTDQAWKREQQFPTGLPTEPVGIAIPHTDVEYVRRSALAVGVFAQPVAFGQMGTDGSTAVQAAIVFLLAIREHEKQVLLLEQLVTTVQTPGLLAALAKADSPQQAFDILSQSSL